MKIFDLTLETYPVSNNETQVVLKPSDVLISHYIADYSIFNTSDLSSEVLNNHLLSMKEFLFNKFQALENVEQSLKDEYVL
jgi:hypothetical protein